MIDFLSAVVLIGVLLALWLQNRRGKTTVHGREDPWGNQPSVPPAGRKAAKNHLA